MTWCPSHLVSLRFLFQLLNDFLRVRKHFRPIEPEHGPLHHSPLERVVQIWEGLTEGWSSLFWQSGVTPTKERHWIPACTGVTIRGFGRLFSMAR